MSTSPVKDALITTVRAERARWEALIVEAGDDRMTVPGVTGHWSLKDILGHVTAYVRFWGARLHAEVTGTPPTPRDLFDTDNVPERYENEDEQNAAIHALYAPLPTAEVIAKWRFAWDRLLSVLSALDEADVTTPGRFAWTGDQSLPQAMAGDTYAHAAAHAAEVRAWLDHTSD